MKILLVETFFSGSHQTWAEGYQQFSQHEVKILSLPGKYWKWRMYGGAVALAKRFMDGDFEPDILLVSDMLDLSTFLALCRNRLNELPVFIYFHENQITYPWSPTDPDVKLKRDNNYGFINYTSALCADKILFNSYFHKASFLGAIPDFLRQFPDYKNIENEEILIEKSEVLSLGLDFRKLDKQYSNNKSKEATILWNHRWEYDKNPDDFFHALFKLKEDNIPFKVIILGAVYEKQPTIFAEAKEKLKDHILHFGFAHTPEAYAQYLWEADILLVTAIQDFFGGSVVEGIYTNNYPILPNRLAYPEHIPIAERKYHFYNNEAEMYELLVDTIKNIDSIRSQNFQSYVKHYDWGNMGKIYDDFFSTFQKSII